MERQTSQLWKTRGVLGEPDVVISGNPYWLLPTVLGPASGGTREYLPGRLKEYRAGIDGGYEVHDAAELPDIVGFKEIPWIFGKKYMDVYQWRVRRSCVVEGAMISGSPLWLLDTVLADAEQRGRATVQDGIDPIRAGEREPSKPRGRKPSAEPKETPAPAGSADLPARSRLGGRRRRGHRRAPRRRVLHDRTPEAMT
ncbi:hypothetical protein ACIRVK_41390 [Streptomyces sp. NPDC101152]|uniref:hypothetical protein n=1 Tax=Streptomyces sp. NPDC101152 TaxID=3366116 RepID=UPI00380D3E54